MEETPEVLEQLKRTYSFFWHAEITICLSSDGHFLETFLLSEVFDYPSEQD